MLLFQLNINYKISTFFNISLCFSMFSMFLCFSLFCSDVIVVGVCLLRTIIFGWLTLAGQHSAALGGGLTHLITFDNTWHLLKTIESIERDLTTWDNTWQHLRRIELDRAWDLKTTLDWLDLSLSGANKWKHDLKPVHVFLGCSLSFSILLYLTLKDFLNLFKAFWVSNNLYIIQLQTKKVKKCKSIISKPLETHPIHVRGKIHLNSLVSIVRGLNCKSSVTWYLLPCWKKHALSFLWHDMFETLSRPK